MSSGSQNPNLQLLAELVLVAAVGVAFALGGDLGDGLVSAGIVLGFVVLVHASRRRSGTLEVMGGIGDERTRQLYVRACAFAGTVMAIVLPAWWLVTVAEGDPNPTLSLLCAIFAGAFIGAVIVLPPRS